MKSSSNNKKTWQSIYIDSSNNSRAKTAIKVIVFLTVASGFYNRHTEQILNLNNLISLPGSADRSAVVYGIGVSISNGLCRQLNGR
jgi:hypothetical protein